MREIYFERESYLERERERIIWREGERGGGGGGWGRDRERYCNKWLPTLIPYVI